MWTLLIYIVKFWYFEAPRSLISYFISINKSFLNAFSLPLMLKTFFKPWKNEYREGLIRFSIFMGIVIKTLFISVDLFLFSLLIFFEIIVFVFFLSFPIVMFYLPFIKI